MAKNANGEGSIYKRMRDGKVVRYEGAITYVGEDGKTKRHTVYGRTRQDVRDKLKQGPRAARRRRTGQDATRTVGGLAGPVARHHTGGRRTARSPPARCTRTCAASIWNRRRSGRSGWTGCGPPTSRRWCWRCGPRASPRRSGAVGFVGAVGVHRAAAGAGRGGPRRAAGTQSRRRGQAAGRGAHGGQARRRRGRGRAAACCRRARATAMCWC